jgi:hypothetical protein
VPIEQDSLRLRKLAPRSDHQIGPVAVRAERCAAEQVVLDTKRRANPLQLTRKATRGDNDSVGLEALTAIETQLPPWPGLQ